MLLWSIRTSLEIAPITNTTLTTVMLFGHLCHLGILGRQYQVDLDQRSTPLCPYTASNNEKGRWTCSMQFRRHPTCCSAMLPSAQPLIQRAIHNDKYSEWEEQAREWLFHGLVVSCFVKAVSSGAVHGQPPGRRLAKGPLAVLRLGSVAT